MIILFVSFDFLFNFQILSSFFFLMGIFFFFSNHWEGKVRKKWRQDLFSISCFIPRVHNSSRDRARPNPGGPELIRVSHTCGSDSGTWAAICCFAGCSTKLGWKQNDGLQLALREQRGCSERHHHTCRSVAFIKQSLWFLAVFSWEFRYTFTFCFVTEQTHWLTQSFFF